MKTFEPGVLSSSANAEDKMKTARQAARNAFRKTRRVNLGVTNATSTSHTTNAKRASDIGRHSMSDAFVERHVQVLVGN
ncbi:MAG: hypothetical protein OXP66_12105 [Candidatus Tectomicrobia bacterium]|nr:hypothetical protein [Candidatus Tectomicrobia bacterium]